jgi:hypothetical protein
MYNIPSFPASINEVSRNIAASSEGQMEGVAMNVQQKTGQILAGRIRRYAVEVKTAEDLELVEELQHKACELLDLATLLNRNHQISEAEGSDIESAWNIFAESAHEAITVGGVA